MQSLCIDPIYKCFSFIGGTALILASGAVLTTGASTISVPSLDFGDKQGYVYNSAATTISSVISGSNSYVLTKSGAGMLILSGANTYTGYTTINEGTLQMGASNVISDSSKVLVGNGAVFDMNDYSDTIGSLRTGLSRTSAVQASVALGSGTLTVGNDNSSIATDFYGEISGTGGLTKIGTGTQILAGTNTYTGGTAINAGTLSVTGSIGSSTFTINSGGTLIGSGTVGDVTVASGGTFSPGLSPGTLNAGATTWESGGIYLWEVNDATGIKGSDPGFDWFNITGALNITATSESKFNLDLSTMGVYARINMLNNKWSYSTKFIKKMSSGDHKLAA